MGRRNRSNRNSWDEDEDEYGLDRVEKQWLKHRQASKSKLKETDYDVPLPNASTDGENSKIISEPIAQQGKSKDDESPQKDNSKNANSLELDKSHRMKLKKQRQKERQKEKKANRNAAKRQKTDDLTKDGLTKDANTPVVPQEDSPNIATTPEEDKVEKAKLKKQRQKERQREKKAQAASARCESLAVAAEAKKRKRLDSEKASQKKQKQQQEKKATIKEPQHQFRKLTKGVTYQDLVIGKGHTVQHRKKVIVSYTLRDKSHTAGKILDSSNSFGFRLGKSEVIKGWDIGLQDMRVGGMRRLVVPPQAGYGNKDVGAGRGADLFFEVKLLHVAP